MMASILVVDDEKSIRVSFREFLRDAGYEVGIAEDADEAIRMLVAGDFDLVVTDIILPRVTGMNLLKSIKGVSPHVQVILMTGEPTVETASDAVRVGAFDYLSKPIGKELLLKTVAKAAMVKALDDERWHLEEALKQSEEQYRTIFEGALQGIYQATPGGRYINANPALAQIYGYDSPAEFMRSLTDIGHQLYVDPTRRETFIRLMAEDGRLSNFESQIYRKKGSLVWISETARAVRDGAGAIRYYEGFVIDITARKYAEELERERTQLQAQNLFLQEEVEHSRELNDLIGQSPAMLIIRKQLDLVAPTDATVLIQGESGVGKELIATEIHQRSHRKHKPMVRVNCASIPRDLYESEFFGHVKGAFTGAVKDRPGRFEAADGGTLFLDEVGEIPLELQGKLLRVLQEQQYERVGDDKTRSVDVRIIVATNRDLWQEVEARRFRQDLFYRLNVFPLEAPPLRERLEDLPSLTAYLIAIAAKKLNCSVPPLTVDHISELQQYSWPGNVRELQNIVERAVITSRFGPLQFDLPNNVDGPVRTSVATKKAETVGEDEIIPEAEMQRRERENLIRALRRTEGKLYGANGAAALLGVNPTTLASRIRKMGLQQSRSMKMREWLESLTTEFPTTYHVDPN